MKRFLQLFTLFILLVSEKIYSDPLNSWNEGKAKSAIIQFVSNVTDRNSPCYIPVEDRIAVFDQDGTLWVEQPMYTQMLFAFDRIRELASQHPEWNSQSPFKAILSHDLEAMKNFKTKDIELILVATHSGMSVDEFHQQVSEWLRKAVHPRFKRPFTELVYVPMLELMQYLREHQFDVYIVSGGGQEFMRAYADKVYKIPLNRIVGTVDKVRYEYRNGNPILMKTADLMFINDKTGKPEGINLMIGKRPVAAFGNSIGDQQMLEWTQARPGKTLQLLVHHDDRVREYAYGPDSKVGTFSDALMDEATRKGWIVVSMKNDWNQIFQFSERPCACR